MSTAAKLQTTTARPAAGNSSSLLLQRKCACGNGASNLLGKCKDCDNKELGLQRKLMIGASNDPLEQEADRVADQVMTSSASRKASNTPQSIRRFPGQSNEGEGVAPASVERALAGSGRPLEPALRNDMEQRFRCDFSQVRVRTGSAAEQSVRDVGASAYTVGQNIVFGAGHFNPATRQGLRLITHELTHVVQQSGPDGVHAGFDRGASSLSTISRKKIVQRDGESGYRGGGGSFGGGGATDSWGEEDAARQVFPSWGKMSVPTVLEFYHGTRWSVAQNIGRIEPRGVGDFAAGFYTHFEPENNPAALNRAKKRGQWAASQDPQEPYAGVLSFKVPTKRFVDLLNTRSRVFPLLDLKQPDYQQRQREWLNYVTTHGRESSPRFFADQHNVERWRHHELQSPAVPPTALTVGPFYTPKPGLPGVPPQRSEFHPIALEPATPTKLQQQVTWANEGIDLLNASPRATLQFDRKTGDPVVPPVPASFAPPPGSERYTSQNPSDDQ